MGQWFTRAITLTTNFNYNKENKDREGRFYGVAQNKSSYLKIFLWVKNTFFALFRNAQSEVAEFTVTDYD